MAGRMTIDGEVLELVRTSIRSVWRLELLLLMWRSSPARWSAADLVRELRASDEIVSDGLASLQAAGLVTREGERTFRYSPAAPELDCVVQELARVYRDRPTAVRKAIFENPNEKLQTFADAFRIRKD